MHTALSHPDPLTFPGKGSSQGSLWEQKQTPRVLDSRALTPSVLLRDLGRAQLLPHSCTRPTEPQALPHFAAVQAQALALSICLPSPPKLRLRPLLLCSACLSEQAGKACETGFSPNTELAWLRFLSCSPLERSLQSSLSREPEFSPSWIYSASLTSEQGPPGDHWGLV